MSHEQQLSNRVRTCRIARGWSQDDLAVRAGISRAGVSSIETSRLVPSTSAALALAAALECRVEDLFQLGSASAEQTAWAWQPEREPCRYWRASVAGREPVYPVEPTNLGVVGHDGVCEKENFASSSLTAPSDTLVIASCDPAIGLLAANSAPQQFSLTRLSAIQPASPCPVCARTVHVAGIHLAAVGHRNRTQRPPGGVARRLSFAARARWQEGLAAWPGPATPKRPCGGRVAGPLGGARSRFGSPRVARRAVARSPPSPAHRLWTSRRGGGRALRLGGRWRLPAAGERGGRPGFSRRPRGGLRLLLSRRTRRRTPASKPWWKRCGRHPTAACSTIFPAMTRRKPENWNESSEPQYTNPKRK